MIKKLINLDWFFFLTQKYCTYLLSVPGRESTVCMSGILDAFGTKKHRVLYSGSITGDPVRKDPAASRRYVQMRLLDCFLQRKHKEALLLLDALLVDREIRITVYWKVT
jgi:hypothetical protein